MSVSVLIITHTDIGSALLEAARTTYGKLPLQTKVICIHENTDPDHILVNLEKTINDYDEGDGVLLLTDIYGSTPSNIATALREKTHTRLVAGLNLPMLIRVMNYPQLSLEKLAEKAYTGGREGVVDCK